MGFEQDGKLRERPIVEEGYRETMYWLLLCQLDTAGVTTEKGASLGGNASMRSNRKAFSQLVIKRERPLVGGTISELVILVL
jgi:hypothetical protein